MNQSSLFKLLLLLDTEIAQPRSTGCDRPWSLNGYPIAVEMEQQVRLGFEKLRDEPDIAAIKYHLSMGRAQLKELTEMLDMMRA